MGVGFDNFKKIFNDPLVRDPFLSVFLWTFVYAGSRCCSRSRFGLFLAITLNKSGPSPAADAAGAARSIPYAIPPSSPCSSGAAC